MKGIMAGSVVVLTDDDSGLEIVDIPAPDPITGYKVESHWELIDNRIYRVHSFVPLEGTAEEAALKLSRLQFMSLPDVAAYEFRALAPEWIAGESYYGPDDESGVVQSRVLYQGDLYKGLTTHVSQADWTPTMAPSLWAKILPGQEGNTPETGYAEWVQPGSTNGYSNGDQVTHNGHLWESTSNDNVWEPGAVGAPWTDLGVYPPEETA